MSDVFQDSVVLYLMDVLRYLLCSKWYPWFYIFVVYVILHLEPINTAVKLRVILPFCLTLVLPLHPPCRVAILSVRVKSSVSTMYIKYVLQFEVFFFKWIFCSMLLSCRIFLIIYIWEGSKVRGVVVTIEQRKPNKYNLGGKKL